MSKPATVEKERNGFTFFRSFRDAIAMTDPHDQLTLYNAIADYALDQIEPDVSTFGVLGRVCWTAIRPNIESGLTKFRNGCKGGAPKGNSNAKKSTEKQPKINRKTTYPLLNENENENENEDENVNEDMEREKKGSARTKKCAAFIPPSKDDVTAYIADTGLSVDAECFCNHYESNGWMVGRNRMKDWRAAVRNWHRRSADSINEQNQNVLPV